MSARIQAGNDAPIDERGDHVLYWMISARRTRSSFALDRAIELARRLDRPLIVLEPLRAGYRWASDRIHRFVIDGMADNARRFARSPILHHPYVEPEPGAGKGLLEALAARACAVVTDRMPVSFFPRMVEAAGKKLAVRLEEVDSNGLIPLAAPGRTFATAYAFRRWIQANIRSHLAAPRPDPLARLRLPEAPALAAATLRRWPRVSGALLAGDPGALAELPIDHDVPPTALRGGERSGRRALDRFVRERLDRYAEDRNHPDREATSGLSPYLHFGHVSAHELFARVTEREDWTPLHLAERASGSREGFYGLSPSAEAFLDQLVTWRELGYNFCHHRPDHDRYSSIPDWAKKTLAEHASDPRPERYGAGALERAETADPVWNAAQRELLREGRIHNYLRMLWGKKILEWSASPERAFSLMVRLNDRWALDGRDPNSYSGISWVFGHFDRPWGPDKPIIGMLRPMSSTSARRKLEVSRYLAAYG